MDWNTFLFVFLLVIRLTEVLMCPEIKDEAAVRAKLDAEGE